MINKELTIKCEGGLHARTAALFVRESNKFESQILIEYENKKINAKSIMGVLSLGIKPGEKMFILANGKDENDAVEALTNMIENNFME